MKILLDNCLDWRVRRLLPAHQVVHAKDVGWERLENGVLIAAVAEAGYDVLMTIDKKIRNQQNLNELPVTVFEIDSPDSRLPEITRLAPFILEALPDAARFRFLSVNREGVIERLMPRAQP